MLPWVCGLPQRRPTCFLVSLGRRGQTGVLGRGQGLTLHLLSEAVDIIGLIGVADAIGSHAWKLILVPIAAFPWSVDGVPAGNPEWMLCDTRGTEGVRGLGPGILLPWEETGTHWCVCQHLPWIWGLFVFMALFPKL